MARVKQTQKRSKKGKRGKHPTKSSRRGAKTVDQGVAKKKPHRFRPGTVALRWIRKYQKSVDVCINKTRMARMLSDASINHPIGDGTMGFTAKGTAAAHAAVEATIITLLEDMNTLAVGQGRPTAQSRDFKAVCALRRQLDLSTRK